MVSQSLRCEIIWLPDKFRVSRRSYCCHSLVCSSYGQPKLALWDNLTPWQVQSQPEIILLPFIGLQLIWSAIACIVRQLDSLTSSESAGNHTVAIHWLTAHMANQVQPQRIFDSLMIIRYKQGHPESKIVAIHWFDNPYGQPNTVPRGIDHMSSQGPYFSHGPRIYHCQFMVWWSTRQPRTQNTLLTTCRSGLHKLAIMAVLVIDKY